MPSYQEYDAFVRYSRLVSVVFVGLAILVFFSSTSLAQINGVPSSVTSPGFGGRAVNGTRSSVTSLGPLGYAPQSSARFYTTVPDAHRGHDGHHHHRHYNGEYSWPLVYAVPVPYAVEETATDENSEADEDANYQGGPTIFDRRGQGARSYVPPVKEVPTPHAGQSGAESLSDPAPPQEPTLLVFKDRHTLEVGNYAIVGATLYDLTPGHARRIALADLDLDATRKQNEDRGIVFQLPLS